MSGLQLIYDVYSGAGTYAIGIFVDGALKVVEFTVKHMNELKKKFKDMIDEINSEITSICDEIELRNMLVKVYDVSFVERI